MPVQSVVSLPGQEIGEAEQVWGRGRMISSVWELYSLAPWALLGGRYHVRNNREQKKEDPCSPEAYIPVWEGQLK